MSVLTLKIKRKYIHIRSQRHGAFLRLDVMHCARAQLSPNALYTASSGLYGSLLSVLSTIPSLSLIQALKP